MNPISISTLATLFSAAGAIVGVPSLAVLVLYAVTTIQQRLFPAPAGMEFSSGQDAILMMLTAMVKAFGFLARMMDFLFGLLAIAAGFGLVLGVALWLTGRGLHVNAPWARVSAYVLLIVTMLPALLLALSTRDTGRLVMLLVVLGCGLGLHALWVTPALRSN